MRLVYSSLMNRSPLRVRGDTGSPHELARIVAEVAERAVVLAVYVADGDTNAARGPVHGAVWHVEPAVGRDGCIGRVVETTALHGGESNGEVVFENGGVSFGCGLNHYLSSSPLESIGHRTIGDRT